MTALSKAEAWKEYWESLSNAVKLMVDKADRSIGFDAGWDARDNKSKCKDGKHTGCRCVFEGFDKGIEHKEKSVVLAVQKLKEEIEYRKISFMKEQRIELNKIIDSVFGGEKK